MHIACWIPRATNTHSGCVILTLQQWSHECPSMLRYTYNASIALKLAQVFMSSLFFSASLHWYAYWKIGNHVLGKKSAYSKHCTFEVNYSIDVANNKVTSYLSHKSQEGTKVT